MADSHTRTHARTLGAMPGQVGNTLAVVDLLFCTLFGVSFWYWDAHTALLVVFFTLAVLSNLLVWRYAKQCNDDHNAYNKSWHHSHETLGILLVSSRMLILGTFVTIVVMQKAGIDVAYTLMHVDTLLLVLVLVMCGAILLELYLAYSLYQHHYRRAVSSLPGDDGYSPLDGASNLLLVPCAGAGTDSMPTAAALTKQYWERREAITTRQEHLARRHRVGSMLL